MEGVAIGWDVGGWHGKANAVVVLGLGAGRVEPLGMGGGALPPGSGSLRAFVEHFCGPVAGEAVAEAPVVVLAVDAPLGWPRGFGALVASAAQGDGLQGDGLQGDGLQGDGLQGDALRSDGLQGDGLPGNGVSALAEPDPSGRFIDNPYAFRDTDRAVARRFPHRRPMSASFDRLGNPATVAIRYTRAWSGGAGPCCTADAMRRGEGLRVMEVYPALAKAAPVREAATLPVWSRAMPAEVAPGTHLHDAAIAAVMGLGARAGDDRMLPVMEPAGGAEDEGAIWVPANAAWCVPAPARGGGAARGKR